MNDEHSAFMVDRTAVSNYSHSGCGAMQDGERQKMTQIKYYYQVFRWIIRHKKEKNCRQKWKRMDRELSDARVEMVTK